MNINIIQIILLFTVGLMMSPTQADSRFAGSNSIWGKNSTSFKYEQKSRHQREAKRNVPQKNYRYSDKWSGQFNQPKEHKNSQEKQYRQDKQHHSKKNHSGRHVEKQKPKPNSYYPANRWKRIDNQPAKRNGHNAFSKHKKKHQYRDTKNQHTNTKYRSTFNRFGGNNHTVIKKRNNRHSAKRHNRRNYWTPWYNTRFIAPIRRHYHRIGHRLRYLPKTRIRLFVGGLPYFYFTGMFYRFVDDGYIVVSAPFNAVLKNLPLGFVAFTIGLTTYYMANETYYLWDDGKDGYVVVPKPSIASQALEEATQGRLFAYPNNNQSEDQQAKDRYECHQWAVSELGVDPTLEEQDITTSNKSDYKRGITACLVARDYTVN